MTIDQFHHLFADSSDFRDDSSRPWMEHLVGSTLGEPEFNPRTLEDDPAFSRLLDSLDEYARASERSARRSFVCAVVSSVGTILALVVAIASFLAN